MSGATGRGVVAGVVAATAVAVFFLIVDALVGEPLRTPSFLSSLMTGSEPTTAAPLGRIVLYTVVHFAMFALVGLLVSHLLRRLGLRPMLLLGLVLGVIFFDLVFYGVLVWRGVDILEALGWPQFLAGNLVGGAALLGWLEYTGPEPAETWREVLAHHRTIREGLIAGVLGGTVVVLWFLLVDVIFREPFFTPAALGAVVFEGASSLAEVNVDIPNVLGYTALHFAAFFFVGLLAAAIAAEAERHAVVLLGAVLLFVTFETLFLGLTTLAAAWLFDVLNPWVILVANLVAAFVMGWYLWHAHPRLADRLLHHDVEQEEFDEMDEDVSVSSAPYLR